MEVNGQLNSTTAVPSGICLMNGRVLEPVRTLSLSGIKLHLLGCLLKVYIRRAVMIRLFFLWFVAPYNMVAGYRITGDNSRNMLNVNTVKNDD